MLDNTKQNTNSQAEGKDGAISRRRALQIGLAMTVGLSGCGSYDGGNGQSPQETENDPTKQGNADEDAADKDAIDIREYGAAVDGQTDDTVAVAEAIEAAEPGETVFFPAGTTVVSARHGIGPDPEDDWGPAVYLDSSNSGVTLQGEGRNSKIQMAGQHPADHNSFVIQIDCETAVENVAVQDLTIDGNRSENPSYTIIGISCWPGGSHSDVLIENIWAQDCPEIGIQLRAAGTRINHCTAMNNGRHGINLSNRSIIQDPSVEATNVLSINNGGLGINHNGGDALLDRFYSAGNHQGGMKFSWNAANTTVTNGFFVANRTMGFRYNGSDPPDETIRVKLDNIVAKNNGYAGFWLSGDARYDVGCLVAEGNNISGEQEGNIEVLGRAEVSAADIISSNAANGYGFYYRSERQTSIERYSHINNALGGFDGSTLHNLDIKEALEQRGAEPNVPDISMFGAGRGAVPDGLDGI